MKVTRLTTVFQTIMVDLVNQNHCTRGRTSRTIHSLNTTQTLARLHTLTYTTHTVQVAIQNATGSIGSYRLTERVGRGTDTYKPSCTHTHTDTHVARITTTARPFSHLAAPRGRGRSDRHASRTVCTPKWRAAEVYARLNSVHARAKHAHTHTFDFGFCVLGGTMKALEPRVRASHRNCISVDGGGGDKSTRDARRRSMVERFDAAAHTQR